LLPPARVRPQGGGVANIDDEAVFAAIIYVLAAVLPRDAGAVDVQDRVDDLPQVMHSSICARPGSPGTPGGEDWFDQGPSGVGEITAVRTTSIHASPNDRQHHESQNHPSLSTIGIRCSISLGVEGRWAASVAASPQPVADLVGRLGNDSANSASPEVIADRA
jgi:hypothetical protein